MINFILMQVGVLSPRNINTENNSFVSRIQTLIPEQEVVTIVTQAENPIHTKLEENK
jgi:agmatine/peptidylarginine deiminase